MIFLVGMMGSGKSTVAERLAKILGWPVVDLDERIESMAGMSIAEIFRREGEGGFRRREQMALQDLTSPQTVVATGGGVILQGDNVATMKEKGLVVYLEASPEILKERLERERDKRPLLKEGLDVIDRIFTERRALYEEAAQLVISVDGLTANEVAKALSSSLSKGLVV